MQPDFKTMEQYLSKFEGGEVFLSKKYFERGLAVIYFHNPGKKNAMSGTMMVQLRECVLELEKWNEGKAVLLCGKGGNFCSGGDLEFAKATGTRDEALLMSTWMQDTLWRLQNLPLFSVCLVQGPTLGGGAEITTFCDFIVAADDVRLGFVQGKMGIITAWGGTTRLVEKIGMKRALNLFLTSQILTAKDCFENGIADYVVPWQDALGKTLEWIDLRLRHDARIVRSFKKAVNYAVRMPCKESLQYEKELCSFFWGNDLNRAALAKNLKHVINGNSSNGHL